jgi:D-3-phosphoglycerate dehydrogenase
MATNKKKIFITESMSQQGRALLNARDDIDLIEFPNMISQADFNAKLKEHAPVHGVALGGTRFGEPELESSKDMLVVTRIGVGFDAVDVPALSRRKVQLMVAGTANSPSVAECAMFMMLTLAKRATEMHALVRDNRWPERLGMLPFDLFGKTILIVGADVFGVVWLAPGEREARPRPDFCELIQDQGHHEHGGMAEKVGGGLFHGL